MSLNDAILAAAKRCRRVQEPVYSGNNTLHVEDEACARGILGRGGLNFRLHFEPISDKEPGHKDAL